MSNHNLWYVCPNCGAEYDQRIHQTSCPACGQTTAEKITKAMFYPACILIIWIVIAIF